MKMLTMTNLSTECLIQLTKLGYDETTINQILMQNEKRELLLGLGKVTEADAVASKSVTTTHLVRLLRDACHIDLEACGYNRDYMEVGKRYCTGRVGGATCEDRSAQIYARLGKNDLRFFFFKQKTAYEMPK